jgi:3-dehydroquinate synthase
MALDTTYARDRGVITEGDWRRVIGLIAALGLPLFAPALEAADQDAPVLRGLEEFREHLGGVLTIMLPTGIGRTRDVHEIETDAMIRSIAALKTLDADRPARGAVRTHAGSASGQGA